MWDWVHRLSDSPDESYLNIVVGTFALASVVIVLHFVVCLLRRPATTPSRSRWRVWEKLLYLILTLAVLVLAGTSWYAMWTDGVLAGWLLMLHMAGAGTFVTALPLVALAWAYRSRFFVDRVRPRSSAETEPRTPQFLWLARVAFWVILAAGFLNVMTMLISMLPLFGTDDLTELLTFHRYTGLAVVAALLLHIYANVLTRLHLR
jgi:hypothetical protein